MLYVFLMSLFARKKSTPLIACMGFAGVLVGGVLVYSVWQKGVNANGSVQPTSGALGVEVDANHSSGDVSVREFRPGGGTSTAEVTLGELPLDYSSNPKLQLDDADDASFSAARQDLTADVLVTDRAAQHLAGRLTNDTHELHLNTGLLSKDGRLTAGILMDNLEDRNIKGYEIGTKGGSISYSEDEDTFKLQLKKKF